MTVTAVSEALEGQKVRITRREGDPLEGRAEAISNIGVLLKVKGKSSTQLILSHEIADNGVELIEENTDIVQSVLQPVKFGNVRRHLVSGHGWTLSRVNKIDDKEAWNIHESLHSGEAAADLGHRHEAKSDKKKNSSPEQSEDQPALTEE